MHLYHRSVLMLRRDGCLEIIYKVELCGIIIVQYFKAEKGITKTSQKANITFITILELIKVVKLTLYYHLIIIAFLSACDVSSPIF